MSRYAGRHRDADPSVGQVPEVPAAPETLELSRTLPAIASPAPRSRRSQVARVAGAVVALSLLAVGAVDVVTTRAGDGAIGLVAAPPSTLPPQAALEAVAYRADAGDLSTHRAEVRDARAEADAAAARAAAEPPRGRSGRRRCGGEGCRPKAAADAAAAEAQRQAAAERAARDAQRQSVVAKAQAGPQGRRARHAGRVRLRRQPVAPASSALWTRRERLALHRPRTRRPAPTASRSPCPAAKMASVGSDYRTNPVTQIRWGLGYIKQVLRHPVQRARPGAAAPALVLTGSAVTSSRDGRLRSCAAGSCVDAWSGALGRAPAWRGHRVGRTFSTRFGSLICSQIGRRWPPASLVGQHGVPVEVRVAGRRRPSPAGGGSARRTRLGSSSTGAST